MRNGFTMIELMVTVFLIAMILVIGAFAASAIIDRRDESATRGILEQLEVAKDLMALDGIRFYDAPSAGSVRSNAGNWTAGPREMGYDIHDERSGIELFMQQASRHDEARQILDRLRGRGHVGDSDGDGLDEVLDAWGRPIRLHMVLDGDAYYSGVLTMPTPRRAYFRSTGANGIAEHSLQSSNIGDDVLSYELVGLN